MLDATVTSGRLQQIDETDQIAPNVGVGVVERITHAGLSRQVNDAAGLPAREQSLQSHPVHDIGFDLVVAVDRCDSPGLLEAVALELRVVVVVEIVQPDDEIAARQQRGAHGLPDETGAACN